jgi:SAM-dependent methyltransferase
MVLDAEKKALPALLAQFYGTQSMLIGSPRQFELLKSSMIPNQVLLSPLLSHQHNKNFFSIESGLHDLPIASGSVDLVLLPHILEYIDNPRQALAEACRIIKPQGHIVIFGFNPYSLWGIKKLLSHEKTPPWSGNFFSSSSIKEWLTLSDFELIKHKTFFYRPPLNSEKFFNKLKIMEWLGRHLHLPVGGIYLIVAQAKVIPLTPIKLTWKQKLSDVRLPVIGVPRPTVRNQR